MINKSTQKWTAKKYISLALAIMFLFGAWFFLNYKLLSGDDWISETYDNENWKTNEGNLHTYGAWDFETHVWKSEYIIENFPNYQWNPSWYLGMPLLEYYQSGFYILHIAFIFLTSQSPAKSAILLIVIAHLAAVLLTFLLCYRISKKIWVSALSSVFLIASTFITLRSYGWEPISVVFLFFYPLTLIFFLKNPTKPFRASLIILLTLSYLSHPLIFFSLCMAMGLFLLTLALKENKLSPQKKHNHYIWKFLLLVIISLLLGAVQFIPQISYSQQTSGAHMGVSYIPFYHVQYNIISLQDFFFDAGNLKGPGLSVMIALSLAILFLIYERKKSLPKNKKLLHNPLTSGFLVILITMVLFYYLEFFNIFPMNLLRSIQYHRIIPEFIITSSAFVAALSTIISSKWQKITFYSVLIAFVLASFFIIYNVQTHWQTTDSIEDKPEFIEHDFEGRISFPYTDQSLSVRSSFNEIPQVYGYYEQGITSPYADELFSVSSGFHSREISLIYLKAANVKRLYINTEEGERDQIVFDKMNGFLNYTHNDGERYAYFDIPLENPSLAESISFLDAQKLKDLEIKCRTLFETEYCGSIKEEFVTKDPEEIRYLSEYLSVLENPNPSHVQLEQLNPELYKMSIYNATKDTAIVVKMNYDSNFIAYSENEKLLLEPIGPHFMLITSQKSGNYDVFLEYRTSKRILAGSAISIATLIVLIIYFSISKRPKFNNLIRFKKGDLK